MNDSEIVELYFEHSDKAIAETREKYGVLVRAVIGGVLRNKSDAEECENDSYMAVWSAIPPHRPENFRAFLLRLARNQALKKLRYINAEKRRPDAVVPLDELNECISSEEHFYSDDELSAIINSFLTELPQETRRIFVLRYWYFYPVKKVAESCGISVSKTDSVLLRTRKKLKKHLEERGFSNDKTGT